MKIDWKGLRQQKLDELPAAKITRQKYLDKITNDVEKMIYKKCKRQEAGTTVCYSTVISSTSTENLICFFTDTEHWSWDEDIKEAVINGLVERLTKAGITVKKVEGWFRIDITLP